MHSLLAERGWDGPLPRILPTTTSTNAELAAQFDAQTLEGTCLVAEEQTAGRGRHERVWSSPARAGLWMSVLVRPGDIPSSRWGWLPLLAGLAVRDAIRAMRMVPVGLKWPNDLVVQHAACGGAAGTAKLGGLLAEVVDDGAGGHGVIIGIGVNVGLTGSELPTQSATSLYLEGGDCDRDALLAGILSALQVRLGQWRSDDQRLADDYRDACFTIGRLVDVVLPGDGQLQGVVTGIDPEGHLLVESDGHTRTVTAGDVIHATI